MLANSVMAHIFLIVFHMCRNREAKGKKTERTRTQSNELNRGIHTCTCDHIIQTILYKMKSLD